MQTETIVHLPGLHSGQQTVEDGRARFNVLACGRRWGKSKYLTRRIGCTLLKERKYGYFAAHYKLVQEVWDELHTRLSGVCKFEVSKNRIRFGSEGVAEFWTLEDEDAGRSRRYHEVGIDEGGLVKKLDTKWNEAIRPTLADFKGSADFAGTPKGRNFFHTAFSMGQDPMNLEWASWQMPTSTNPYIDPSEIEAARLQMPERSFLQEFMAEFLEEAGGVFRGVSLVVDDGRKENENAKDSQCCLGVDLARVEDFTVLTVMDSAGRQIYFDRFNQISWERQVAEIETIAKKYKATVFMDSTGLGDPIYERVRKLGVNVKPYHLSNASKEALIDNLAMKIEQGKVSLMDLPVQTDELLAYEYTLTPSRNVTMNAPAGMHDDTVIALALAAWGLQGGSGWGKPILG